MSSENSRRGNGALLLIARILIVIEAAGAVLMCLVLNNILPIKYLGIVIGVSVLIIALQIVLVSGRRGATARSVISIFLSLAVIALSVYVVLFIRKTETQLESMTETVRAQAAAQVVTTMNVYVRKADGYTELSQLKGKNIGVLDMMDNDNVDAAIIELGNQFGEAPIEMRYIGIMPLINSLRNVETDAVIINASYENAILDNDDTFHDWAELLCSLQITKTQGGSDVDVDAQKNAVKKPSASVNPVDVTMQPFLVYLTGMDTRGDEIVAEVGNSDVNMVIAVNPKKKTVLMINIPRDYYYYLWGDSDYPDKITHSGYYGVDCGIQTMESLFDIDINYYVKVGFNSVINIVDAIGGIQVYSDYEFELDGYYLPAGENYLDGYGALQFSRERDSLPGGDRARGMNQQKVISAIIDKVTSPDMLRNFNEILKAFTSNVVTNVTVADMEAIVKKQLDDGGSWNVESVQVDGSGAWDYCYSLGDANDVMVPDWSTVDNAKARLQEVLSN